MRRAFKEFAVVFLLSVSLLACGRITVRHAEITNATVKLYVSGNEPFTRLMAEFPDGTVMPVSKASPSYQDLWQLQGKSVRILKGKIQKVNQETILFIDTFENVHTE